jgi:hypothetical protein
LAPPLIASREELERIVDALDHGLEVADRVAGGAGAAASTGARSG